MGEVVVDQGGDIVFRMPVAEHVTATTDVAQPVQAVQALGDAVGIGDGRVSELLLAGQDIAGEEDIVDEIAGVACGVARQRKRLNGHSTGLDSGFRDCLVNSAGLRIKARGGQLANGLDTGEGAHGSPDRVLYDDPVV